MVSRIVASEDRASTRSIAETSMDFEPSTSKQEEKEDGICKRTTSSSYFTSLQGSPKRHDDVRNTQCMAAGIAATAVLIVMIVLLIKHSGFIDVENATELSPSKLLEEVLQNKDAYLSQLANQDWWNLFLNEYNITPPPLLPPFRDLLPQSKKKRPRPGLEMASKGATAKYPIVMIPGFVTSGLEYWGSPGSECARTQKYHFRQRLWTAVGSAKSFLSDRECWRQHMLLHPYTGGDPDDPPIRLRAATGFDAVDYFLGNYWVFGKILENLADVGYNPSNMAMEPYDWRLSFPVLEERDGYLTKLRYKIESMVNKVSDGRRVKVVLTSHSMGALLVTYFFQWVTIDASLGGGGGGADWVDRHIEAYVNIAGTHLGVAKAATALLSGEMSETIYPEPMGSMVEQFFGRSLRRGLWSSWGSLWSMLPLGGDALWSIGADLNCTRGSSDNVSTLLNKNGSTHTSNKDDPFCPRSADSENLSPLVVMTDDIQNFNSIGDDVDKDNSKMATDNMSNSEEIVCEDNEINAAIHDLVLRQKHSIRDILDYLRSFGGGYGKNFSSVQLHSLYKGDDDDYKNDNARPKNSKTKRDGKRPKKAWHDPTQTPLPYAPNLRIYCLYGVGVRTERAYYYKRNHDEAGGSGGTNGTTATGTIPPTSFSDPPIILDSSINDPDQSVQQGVRYADGDGSVPLLSLGYLCTDAWRRPDSGLNPSNAAVITREYQHRTEFVVDDPMRGGPYSADHVDVLGNVDLMTDLLRVATDFEMDQVNQDKIASDIERIAQEINRHPKGGIYGVSSSSSRVSQRGQRRKWLGFLQK